MAQGARRSRRLAVFRADAGPRIGGGHVMRCLTLAGALARHGWDCAFAVAPGSAETVPTLAHAGFPVIEVEGGPKQEARILIAALSDPAELLVIDHPHYAATEERAFGEVARERLAIDGRFRRHSTEVWLDPNPGHDPLELQALANPDCAILTGAEYVPIAPRIAASRAESLRRRGQAMYQIRHVLVSFGAGEQAAALDLALDAVARIDRSLALTVLAGGSAAAVRDRAARLGLAARVFDWSDDMGQLMAEADLMIGAAGTNAWERCCLGLPSLLATVAEDQLATAALLNARGAAIDLGPMTAPAAMMAERIAGALRLLSDDSESARELSQRAAALIDGMGADRVAAAITRRAAAAQSP